MNPTDDSALNSKMCHHTLCTERPSACTRHRSSTSNCDCVKLARPVPKSLLAHGTCAMYIPSTPQVSEGVDPAQVLHEDDTSGAEGGTEGDVESTIAVQDGGCGPVQFQALRDGNYE